MLAAKFSRKGERSYDEPRNQEKRNIILRLKVKDREVIERTAAFEGKTVRDFIVSSALDAAERKIYIHQVMKLDKEDFKAFLNALSKPVKLNAKLKKDLKEHGRRVVSE